MPGEWLVGRTPDSDSVEIPKSFADSLVASLIPTVSFVKSKIALASVGKVTPAYVNQSNAQLAHKTAVTAADALYVPTTALNAANGVAGLDSSGNLIGSQIPDGVPTEFAAKYYDVSDSGTVFPNTTQTVSTNNLRELKIASIEIDDPGYPWRAQPFALVQGGDPGGTNPGSRLVGTNTYGLLSVLPPQGVSNQVYAAGICTDTFAMNYYQCFPYAAPGQTPTSVPPIVGGIELDLCGSCWTGTGYQFSPVGLLYWVLVLPAL